MTADPLEDVAQVSEGTDAESLRSRDQAGEHCGGAPAVVTAQKCPIPSTYREGSGRRSTNQAELRVCP
jgi:hypothetical protein